MKENYRLMLSLTLTILIHGGLLFYVGQSAATVPSNKASKAMQFNLTVLANPKESEQKITQKKPMVTQSKEVKVDIFQTQTSVKKVLVEKETPMSKDVVQPKKEAIASNNDNEIKSLPIAPLPVETATESTASSHAQEKPVKDVSVTRPENNTIVQKARFKSLPPAPSYPRQARLRGQQGTALIHAHLNTTGEVIKTRLVKSSGFSLLDKAAIKAVYHWDFMPGATELGNVQVWVEIPVTFILQPVKVG